MCGRFSFAYEDWYEFVKIFQIDAITSYYPKRYNIAPTQKIPVVISDGSCRRFGQLRWGLVPSWSESEKPSFSTINARLETLTIRPSYRRLIARKRCLILSTGWFEWTKHSRVAHHIHLKTRRAFGFAGLYDTWRSATGETVHSATIITVPAAFTVSHLHERMPAIVKPEDEAFWLSKKATNVDEVLSILQPYTNRDLAFYRVSADVGNVENDGPELIRRIG